MNVNLSEQLAKARQVIEERRRKQAEEDQKDLEALDRVARLIPSISTSSLVNGAQVTGIPNGSKDQPAAEAGAAPDSDTPNLISIVLETVLSRPGVSLSPRAVFEILEARNFPFGRTDESKRILSVAQAMRKLTERDQPQVKLTRRGSGRKPNLYRAVTQEISPENTRTATGSSEMTM